MARLGSYPINTSLPSIMAVMSFLLALSTSLQTVFLETPILSPAPSKDSPSKSINLIASTSAGSKRMGSAPPPGIGTSL